MEQDVTGYEGSPRPRPHCVTWGSSSPSQKGHNPSPNFRPIPIVAKRSPISATAEYLFLVDNLMTKPSVTAWFNKSEQVPARRAVRCKFIRISASVPVRTGTVYRRFLFVKTNLRHASSVTCVPAVAFLFPKKALWINYSPCQLMCSCECMFSRDHATHDCFMVALCNGADHYIFILWFLSSSIFCLFSSPNLSGRRLDVYHTSAHGVCHCSDWVWCVWAE